MLFSGWRVLKEQSYKEVRIGGGVYAIYYGQGEGARLLMKVEHISCAWSKIDFGRKLQHNLSSKDVEWNDGHNPRLRVINTCALARVCIARRIGIVYMLISWCISFRAPRWECEPLLCWMNKEVSLSQTNK